MQTLSSGLLKTLITGSELQARVRALGERITADYRARLADKPLLAIGMLKGSFIFMADLMREIDLHCEIDFMIASSYGTGTESSGKITIRQDVGDISGQHVLLIEDIVDSGYTMKSVLGHLRRKEPASLALCALLDKPDRRKVSVPVDYLGFTIPDEFVVGYGLDFASRYRNLPYIGVLKPELYENPALSAQEGVKA